MPISDPDCPFCQIVSGDDPAEREIYRNEVVVAFFPTEPATLGHTLIIPRGHFADIWELDGETATALAHATLQLATVVRDVVAPDGLNIIQSNGAAATQTVPHLHVHLVPRWTNDEIGPIWPPETNYSENQKDQAWLAIRSECRNLMGSSPQT